MKNDPRLEKAWLSQFEPVEDSKLLPPVLDSLNEIRKQFPGAKAGRLANGALNFYVIDQELGPLNGPL